MEVKEKLFEMDINVITVWECEIREMQKNENYRKQYLETLKDRIERVFNYCEKDISVQMKISECKEKYNKKFKIYYEYFKNLKNI